MPCPRGCSAACCSRASTWRRLGPLPARSQRATHRAEQKLNRRERKGTLHQVHSPTEELLGIAEHLGRIAYSSEVSTAMGIPPNCSVGARNYHTVLGHPVTPVFNPVVIGSIFPAPMPNFPLPAAATPADLPGEVRLQIVSPGAEPPAGDGWLHEIKHDGHRLVAIVAGGSLQLLSRNGYDRTALFREPFRGLAEAGLPPMVLDGEIAVPDERGVTHLDALSEAISARRPERLAYFAFDLLHLDGHDLRRCPIEDRKVLLRDVIGAARCERIVYVDHVLGIGRELLEAVRQVGAEGIVSKRRGSPYRGGESRDWLKAKCHEIGSFVVTGFSELGAGRLEAIYVAELRGGELRPVGAGPVRLCRQGAVAHARRAARRPAAERAVYPGAARAGGRG